MEKIYDLTDTRYFENNDFEKFEYKEIECENLSNVEDENATYKFNIKGENDNIFYSGGYINLQLKITDKNGAPIGNRKATFVNGGGLFKSKKLQIGAITIETNNESCSVLDQVIRHIHFTNDYSKSEAQNMFFYSDTADTMDLNKLKYDGTLTDTTKMTEFHNNLKINENYNKGFYKRYNLTKNSQSVYIMIPLKYMFDFFNEYRKALTGFHTRMEFTRNTNKDMIITDDINADFKAIVEKISLSLPYVQFKNKANLKSVELKVLNSYIDIYWDHYRIEKSGVNLKVKYGSYKLSTEWDEVSAMYIIPQYIDRNDDYTKNNLIFDNLGMIEYWITANGQDYPEYHYKVNFPNKDYNNAYTALLKEGYNANNTETGCMIGYEEFGKIYPFLCINLSAHKNFTSVGPRELIFHWKLEKNTQKDYMFYFILKERNKCYLNMYQNEFTFIEKKDSSKFIH
ncbi:uncharacterized protein CDAR_13991 [Caerostris darwini]|uniref:Double jelly roll-like domain-containing protein n=1 Tax=Caerostris darwini TaxID=1538125 RepID=A0AAV4W5Q6_9ARAC|nr:uncharacterized protein CDAR_13991 [Caerostris darwini]